MTKQASLYKKSVSPNLFRGLLFLCLFFLWANKAAGQQVKDTMFINTAGSYPVNMHLFVYETDSALTPGYVAGNVHPAQFLKIYPAKTFNDIQHPRNFYWLLLTVKNGLPNEETFYFQLNHPQLYSVIAYKKNADSFSILGKSGYAYAFNQKMYFYYDNVFPLVLKPGQAATYLFCININNGHNPFFGPQLTDSNTFKAKEQQFYTVNGLIAGIMGTAFLLNLFLGISLKDKLHFLYSVYILCILYEIFMTQGLDRQYFYPGATTRLNLLRYITPCACIILLAYIMQWFLNQTRSNSRLKIFIDVINYTCFGLTFLYCVAHSFAPEKEVFTSIFQPTLACLAVVQLVLVFASAVEKVMQGYKPAWFYIAATLCLFTGLIEYVLMYLGLNDIEASELKHPNDMQAGLVIETLIVFFGIVYRYNLFKKEKEVLLTQINTHQANLINSIVSAQEEERKRIAEDLHDDVGATLSALAMHISNIPETLTNSGAAEKYYSYGLFLSNKAVGDIRTIAHNLLPKDFEATGLFKTLAKKIDELNALGKIHFTLITEGDESLLTKVFAITVYRIINELLTNILKHSLASEAALQVLVEKAGIQVMSEDDGIGFNSQAVTSNGIGIKNITGRVQFLKGSINTDSNPQGTTTIIHIPL